MKDKPPWVQDKITISKKARRLQELLDKELKRRESGIPKEHWRYVGLDDSPKKPEKAVPYLKLVEAEVEVLPTEHGGGSGGGNKPTKVKMSWDFYFFMGSLGLLVMVGSYLVVDFLIKALRTFSNGG